MSSIPVWVRNAIVVIAATIVVVALTFCGRVQAGESVGAWFKSLTMPGSSTSCCDISDCRPTKSEWRAGQWWAIVNGKWMPIPPEKVLDKVSILEDAVVCNSNPARYYDSGYPGDPTIYCFVPLPFGT